MHKGHTHLPLRGMSRRQVLGTAGAAGAILVAGLPKVALGAKPGSGIPTPIPHATGPLGLHFFFPGPVDGSAAPTDPTGAHPDGRDPSTIYDFNGFIGQADLSLTGTGTDTTTGETAPYAFNTDMRFMKGVFIDTEGRTQRGAFAFIWLDSTAGSLAGTSPLPEPTDPTGPTGAHSYDPGIRQNGLFWTTPIPVGSVDVHLGAGEALLHATDIRVDDVFIIPNSFARNPTPVPAVIDSLRIHWSGITSTTDFSDAVDRFAGYFLENSATIEVTATTPPSEGLHGFQFVSDPASTTISHFALIGHEQNGAFFPE